jgi:hypothetical protein
LWNDFDSARSNRKQFFTYKAACGGNRSSVDESSDRGKQWNFVDRNREICCQF